MAAGAVPAGWLLADLASGFIHYLADNYGSEKTPLVGSAFIQPFREHHRNPSLILKHDLIERNANNALISVPLLAWIPLAGSGGPALFFFEATAVALALWVVCTNQIHAWAHSPRVPAWVSRMQALGLFLSPTQHNKHHANFAATHPRRTESELSERASHYCITSGVCDRLLAQIR